MTLRAAGAVTEGESRAGAKTIAASNTGRGLLGAALLTIFGAGAALACSPALQGPSRVPELGENCARSYRLTEVDSVSLGQVKDFGGGLIAQPLAEGNGCSFEGWYVVQDCNTGQGLLIGPERVNLLEGPKPSAIQALEKRLAATRSVLTLTQVAEAARAFEKRTPLDKGSALKFGEVRMPLDCGCKSAYPARK